MEARCLGRIAKIQIHWDKILPKLMAILTRFPRYLPEIKWSDTSWTHNIFRVYEKIFWRRAGIRIEVTSGIRDGVQYQYAHTFEAGCAILETKIREALSWRLAPFRVYIPVLYTPQGIPIPASPYLFAIAVDTQTTGGQTTTANSLTWSHTCTGSDLNLIIGLTNGANDTTGVTYAAAAATQDAHSAIPAGTEGADIWRKTAPATGANNVVLSRTGTTSRMTGVAASYTGSKQTGQPDAATTNTATSVTSITTSVTVVATNSWLVGSYDNNAEVPTAGANTTIRQAGSDASGLADSNAAVAAGSRSLIINTVGSSNFAFALISLAPTVTDLTVSVSDQLNITELVTIVLISNINTSDQLNLTEAVTMSGANFINVSDQLNVTESVTLEANNFINVSDQLNITESVTIFINPLFISVSDQLNITESVTTTLFQETLTLSVSDQLNLTENIQTGLDNYISVNDSVTVSESISMTLSVNVNVSDQLNITESVTLDLTSNISVSDQLDITESVTKTFSDPIRGLSYMRGFDQNLPVTMTKQDYPLGFNDTSVS
mgnify:CR=1 FL=1